MPEISDLTSIVTLISTLITGIAGVIIAWLLYRFNKFQQAEHWVKIYMETVTSFWNDPVMAKVRYWINYDKAYMELRSVLQKRKEIEDNAKSTKTLGESEYKMLDDLDKFYTLALELVAINTHLKINFEPRFWKDLFFDYWIFGCLKDGREELQWYVKTFYPELLDPNLPIEKARSLVVNRLKQKAKIAF